VAVHCNERIQLADLAQVPDRTADIISDSFTGMVQRLVERNLIGRTVSTDQASNKQTMLKPIHDYCIPVRKRLPKQESLFLKAISEMPKQGKVGRS
jgi:hypothetical protein